MTRDDVDWRGYWPACPTPFAEDGSYDAEAHRALLDWYVGEGMHGVFVNGTTGEWFSQSPEERRLVAENAIEAVAGRLTVVVGCTSYTAREAAELGRHALARIVNRALELEARAIELRRCDEERVELAPDLRRIELAARIGADAGTARGAATTAAAAATALRTWTSGEREQQHRHPEDSCHARMVLPIVAREQSR